MAAKCSENSFIHGIEVAAPCNVSWESMTGDDTARYCHSCSLNVYNISAMTTAQAEALIIEKEGKLCVSFYRRYDGTVLTRDCPRGLKAIRDRWLRSVAGIAALISVCALYVVNNTKNPMGIRAAQAVQTKTEEFSIKYLPNPKSESIRGRYASNRTAGEPVFRQPIPTDAQVLDQMTEMKKGGVE